MYLLKNYIYKKSFTLVEVIISIALFSIIIIFLYNTLDISRKSNIFFNTKLQETKKEINVKKILFEDLLNTDEVYPINIDKNKNSILSIKTKNMYHNKFYKYVTYLLSKDNKLFRIEHKNKFIKNKYFKDKIYSDVLINSITYFKVIKISNKKYVFAIKNKEDKINYFYINI